MLKASRGFFLIDALLAVTLLSILVVPIISMFLFAQNTATASFQRTTALMLAQERIEELKAMPFEELKDLGNQILEEIFDEGTFYKRCTTLEHEGDLVNIAVQIIWEGRQIVLVTSRGPFEVRKGLHID